MRQVVLIIPDNRYHDFINHVRNSFKDIQIKEKDIDNKNVVAEDEDIYETTLLSEKSFAEDWLSDDDNRWDEVL